MIFKVLDKFPLRTVLILPFVLQIAGGVGLVGYLSFKNGQKAVNNLASQLMSEVSLRVEQNFASLPENSPSNQSKQAGCCQTGDVKDGGFIPLGKISVAASTIISLY
ncbi:MAG: hypothetical protein HC942_00220 [Microcoleus sp. SU_5_6]|nr:hypothetical protein [Microcoleus sp. SU_5_6]